MSVRNYDRHGMDNLKHEPVKPLDRLKFPPFALYLFVFTIFALIAYRSHTDSSLDTEQLLRRNMLLAIKKQKQTIEYETDTEITPAEQVHMKTKQFEQIKQQIKRDD